MGKLIPRSFEKIRSGEQLNLKMRGFTNVASLTAAGVTAAKNIGALVYLSTGGTGGVPCLAITNMPPLPYLERIPGLTTETLEPCYADPRVWDEFDPELTTLASSVEKELSRVLPQEVARVQEATARATAAATAAGAKLRFWFDKCTCTTTGKFLHARLRLTFEREEFFRFIPVAIPGKITRGQYGSEGYAAGGERAAILDCYH